MLFILLATLAFQSKVIAQDDPILFANKTSCEIYVEPFCGDCTGDEFNQGPATLTVPPYNSILLDGECTGDFAYLKFSIDGASVSWYVAFPNNPGACGQDGDCIGVPSPDTVSDGFIEEEESTCLSGDARYSAMYHPNSQGYTCQIVVTEE